MEKIITLHIEKLQEEFFLATSDSVQGLVAQGSNLAETIEIARDVVKKLLESKEEDINSFVSLSDHFDYPIVIGL